jgi:hypothetical protein
MLILRTLLRTNTIMDKELFSKLIQANSHVDFIATYVAGPHRGKALSFAEFARRGGFKSRSTPREIITGRRKLTAGNFSQCVKAMELQGPLLRLFKLLAHQDCPELNLIESAPAQLDAQISKIRQKILERERLYTVPDQDQRSLLKIRYYGPIYAALNVPTGTCIDHIHQLTGIPIDSIREEIKKMVSRNLVKVVHDKGEDLFLPVAPFYNLDPAMAKRELQLKMLDSLRRQMGFLYNVSAEDEEVSLFTEAVFTVKEKDIFALKVKLRKLLAEFMYASEDNNGDTVVNTFVSLIPEKCLHKKPIS